MAGGTTMNDVARHAGVSIMTVSRVLNERPNVTEDVRDRVLAAARELRYQPNELARSLRVRRTRQIGILIPNLYDPFFATCAHFVHDVARQRGYSVVLSLSDENQETEYIEASKMLRLNIEGLVIVPTPTRRRPSRLLDEEFADLPVVTIDRPLPRSNFDSVLTGNRPGARMGTEHLIAAQHECITYVGLSSDIFTMRERHAGYVDAMTHAGLRPSSILVADDLNSTQLAVTRLLTEKEPPTALFCANNLTCRNVLHSLNALGRNVPDDIALVAFDDFEIADLLKPGITVVRQPVEQLSRTAAELLFDRLESKSKRKHPAQKVVLTADLIVRGSCGTRSAAALKKRKATNKAAH